MANQHISKNKHDSNFKHSCKLTAIWRPSTHLNTLISSKSPQQKPINIFLFITPIYLNVQFFNSSIVIFSPSFCPCTCLGPFFHGIFLFFLPWCFIANSQLNFSNSFAKVTVVLSNMTGDPGALCNLAPFKIYEGEGRFIDH